MRSVLIFLLLCAHSLQAQNVNDCGKLRLANEEVLFGFALKNGKKSVFICKDTNNAYIIYRFGSRDNIELSFPSVRDKTSWKQFEYSGYYRGGGKQNAAMGDYTLTFTNKGIVYEVYENWSSEDDSVHLGIKVTANNKTTNLKGDVKRRRGTLDELRFLEDYIPNTWP